MYNPFDDYAQELEEQEFDAKQERLETERVENFYQFHQLIKTNNNNERFKCEQAEILMQKIKDITDII